MVSSARQHEAVAVRIVEDRESAPGLFLGRPAEFDAALRQLAIAVLDVVAGERAVEEGADAILMAVRGEQHHTGLRAGDTELDPALLAHRLVGHYPEPHLPGPEGQRAVLVAGRDADEFELPDHLSSPP